MANASTDDVELVALAECDARDVSTLVAEDGISRYLVEQPYVGDSREQYLLRLIQDDASRDDAIAVAAMQRGQIVGILVLRFPAWDREHFDFEVGRIEHLHGVNEYALQYLVDEAVRQLRDRRVRVCSARISNDSLTAVRCLEKRGFRYVELILSPWRDLSTWEPIGFDVTRATEVGDVDEICAIARRAFRTDRFHRDPGFDPAAADRVYEKWVRTWHASPTPSRFSRVLVAGHEVVGFSMFEVLTPRGHNGDAVTALILCGVDPSRAGQGMGYRMYCDVLDVASVRTRYATVCVASANPAVINLHAKLGFRVTSSGEVTLHRWFDL